MKKIFLILFVLGFANTSFSQTILYKKDKFDGKISYVVSNLGIEIKDDEDKENKALVIIPYIENNTGTFNLKSIYGNADGLNCVEAILIDFIFENEEKLTIKSEYNKFNCEGSFIINMSKKQNQILLHNNISKIRFLNYGNGKTITNTELSQTNKTFLKEILENIEKVNNGLEVKEYVEE